MLGVLFHRLPALIAYWDKGLRNVTANDAYVEWFGRTPAQMRGLHIREALGEAVFELNHSFMQGALAGVPQEFERTLTDVAGNTRHTQTSYVPDIVGNDVRGFFVLVTDITPRVKAQQLLDEAQRLAEIGSWTWNPALDRIEWSAQMFRIFGVDPEVFVPSFTCVIELVEPEDREQTVARATKAQASGTGYEADYRIVRPDGERRAVHSRTATERTPDGQTISLHGTVQDVTEQTRIARELRELNARLDRANRLQADMLAMLGHDARDHISTVRGSLDLVGMEWANLDDDLKLDFIQRAGRGVRRLNELLDDVLTMVSAETGAIAARPQVVSVLDAVRTAIAEAHHSATVRVMSDEDPNAFVDPFHLRQIVLNLVGNAIKYGEAPIGVQVSGDEDTVRVSITDEGEGVPPDFAPKLFDRFARASTGVATTKHGTGFGLYIVDQLARVNGGRVEYRPNEPRGSVFELSLPVRPAADQ